MIIRDAVPADVEAITAIYNDAVEHTTAIWNERTVDSDNRAAWLAERQRDGHPVLVAVLEDGERDAPGEAIAYASYGPWRAFDGYRHTVEHSVYVRSDSRRTGAGEQLLRALISRAEVAGVHVLIAGIEAGNIASIRLHEKLGFETVGTFAEVGTKFGRWLDLTCLQLRVGEFSSLRDPDRDQP
jgi:phosphinothricin acetyltransferase